MNTNNITRIIILVLFLLSQSTVGQTQSSKPINTSKEAKAQLKAAEKADKLIKKRLAKESNDKKKALALDEKTAQKKIAKASSDKKKALALANKTAAKESNDKKKALALDEKTAQKKIAKVSSDKKKALSLAKKTAQKNLSKESNDKKKALAQTKKTTKEKSTKENNNKNKALAQVEKAAKKKAKANAKQLELDKIAATKEANKKSIAATKKKKMTKEVTIAKTSTFKKISNEPSTAKAKSKNEIDNKLTKQTPETRTSLKEAADQYYNYGFKASSDKFLMSKKKLTLEDQIKIANSFRLNHDVENAQIWYSKIADKTEDPIHKLRYAQTLQSVGNNEKASEYYNKYAKSLKNEEGWDDIAELFSKNVTNNERFINSDIALKNESGINTDNLEFSPALFRDGIIFVSTKKPSKFPSIGEDAWINENFMSLYYAKTNESGFLDTAEEFSYDINTKFHEGPVTFSRGYNQIFFTRNHYNNNKRTNNKDGIMKLQIYTSRRNGDRWSDPKELSFNTEEYEECHPSLNPNGSKLYFASDRKGGQGGMDIYVSNLINGEWSEPINLGPEVNTAGNEVFPFIHENGMLFYASNGKDGIGGLDIFQTSQKEGKWAEAKNIGTPFNSKKDDFGFIINDEGSKGYLTSARNNGFGKDDIYSFDLKDDIFNRGAVTICTYDEESGDRIANVDVYSDNAQKLDSPNTEDLYLKVTPTDKKDEFNLQLHTNTNSVLSENASFRTNSEGAYRKTVIFNKEYHYTARIDGYKESSITFATVPETDEYCIPLTKETTCLELIGNVLNASSKEPIEFTQLTLRNEANDPITITADENGAFDFGCIPCGEQFTLKATKDNRETSVRVSTLNISCDPSNKLNKNIYLKDLTPKINHTPSEPNITVGQVIVLENIFYDFDKFYIRSDAQPDLNKVVSLMNQYPSMVIELGSHTDARGPYAYNETLSSNRAQSAVQYIVSRGINANRIVAKGYGETTPRNRCVDGAKCNEKEHQFNRRTEIKVVSFGRDDVEIRYNDNRPDYIDSAPVKKRNQ